MKKFSSLFWLFLNSWIILVSNFYRCCCCCYWRNNHEIIIEKKPVLLSESKQKQKIIGIFIMSIAVIGWNRTHTHTRRKKKKIIGDDVVFQTTATMMMIILVCSCLMIIWFDFFWFSVRFGFIEYKHTHETKDKPPNHIYFLFSINFCFCFQQ